MTDDSRTDKSCTLMSPGTVALTAPKPPVINTRLGSKFLLIQIIIQLGSHFIGQLISRPISITKAEDTIMFSVSRTWAAAIFLAAVVVYTSTVGFGFIFDDRVTVVENTHIRSISMVKEMFSNSYWAGAGQPNTLYRPLVVFTLAVNYALTGLHAWSYHAFNILIHGAVSVGVFLLALTWGMPVIAAGFAGLIFAVHPIHVEAVANVTGRSDLLAAFFLLAMVLLHCRAMKRGGWAFILPALAYLAAMFSKEIGVTGLGLVLVSDLLGKPGFKDNLRELLRRRALPAYLMYLFALSLFLVMRSNAVGPAVTALPFIDNPAALSASYLRILTAITVIVKGFLLLLMPVNLSADYSYSAIPVVKSAFEFQPILSCVVLAAVIFSVVRLRNIAFILPAAAAWYCLALLPASNIIFPIGTIFGERLLYVPSIGFCLIAGFAFSTLLRVPSPRAGYAVIGLVILVLGLKSFSYAQVWSDPIKLFSAAVEAAPNSVRSHYNLGSALKDKGRLDEASYHWKYALSIYPEHVESLGDMGSFCMIRGDLDQARAYLEKAVSVAPERAGAWYNLAILNKRMGDSAGARKCFIRFVETGRIEFPSEVKKIEAMLRSEGVAIPLTR